MTISPFVTARPKHGYCRSAPPIFRLGSPGYLGLAMPDETKEAKHGETKAELVLQFIARAMSGTQHVE